MRNWHRGVPDKSGLYWIKRNPIDLHPYVTRLTKTKDGMEIEGANGRDGPTTLEGVIKWYHPDTMWAHAIPPNNE